MKFIRALFYFVLILATLVVSGLGYIYYINFNFEIPEDKMFFIPKGSSVRSIGASLDEEGIINSKYFFEIYLRFTGQSKFIKVGEYNFKQGETLETVVDKLVRGDVIKRQFTIPEGYNLKAIKGVLIDKDIMTDQEFEDQIIREDLLKRIGSGSTVEGYLFPETYTYNSQSSPSQIFDAMIGMFFEKIGTARIQQARDQGFTLHQLVILASVVEKETGLAKERPLIAGVFHNRLKKKMLLQSDPTVIYGIPNYNGNITKADLLRDTPYNTYTRPGLPIGPICSVGLESIDAVLNPITTDAIFFVGKGDGSHHFSVTLDEHNQAVRYYQLKQGSPP